MRNLLRISKCYSGSITRESDSVSICIRKEVLRREISRLHRHDYLLSILLLVSLFLAPAAAQETVELPNKCEACVIFSRELEGQISLKEGSKNPGAKRDELTLIEAMEQQCNLMLNYKVHKEKRGLARFSKMQSDTMKTLHNLKDRGVKVELGMPYEMWDQPSAEITSLKQQCELMLEQYEDAIERWYNQRERKPLQKFLCEERVLKGKDASCLKRNDRSDL